MLERGGCAVFELLRAMTLTVRALCQNAPRPASTVLPVPSDRPCCPVADHRPPTLRAVEHTTGKGLEPGSHFRVRAVAANARLYTFWGSLTEALCTGQPQNEAKAGGEDPFIALYAGPGRLKGFLEAMTGISLGAAMAIAN